MRGRSKSGSPGIWTNNIQKKRLVELLQNHPDVANGFVNPIWKFGNFTPELNRLGPPHRTPEGWLKVWQNWKRRIVGYMRKMSDSEEYLRCNKLEKQIIEILDSKDLSVKRQNKVGNTSQIKRLIKSLQQHPEVARGTCPRALKKKKFKDFAFELNALGPPQRRWNEWFRVWKKWKMRCLKKSVCPPGQSRDEERHLTEWEEDIIKLLYCKPNIGRQLLQDELISEEESDLSCSGSDDDDNDAQAIVIDEGTVDSAYETLDNQSASTSAGIKASRTTWCHKSSWNQNHNGLQNSEYSNRETHKRNQSPSSISFSDGFNEECSEMKQTSVPATEIHEAKDSLNDIKLKSYGSAESLEDHIEEFLNMKSDLQALKEGHETILQDQILVQKQFHNKVLDFMDEVKTSMKNIEVHMKMSLEKNNSLVELKKETLDVYKQVQEEKASYKQAKLRLKAQLLESKRRKLDDIKHESER